VKYRLPLLIILIGNLGLGIARLILDHQGDNSLIRILDATMLFCFLTLLLMMFREQKKRLSQASKQGDSQL